MTTKRSKENVEFQYSEIGTFNARKATIALLELADEIRAIEKLEAKKKNQGKIK
ncbi:hypothetical protein [Bacillus wiedmannii]|uniref:hypothetical protein n=1 Tax=Bacillus wiedmannii TaxID=1890302 RepID=UPI0015D47E95|nr:hypothetical protein [Bacillus wiedmannii]